jgi:DNA invertase Pin-like site-specific DNA recombinase
MWDEVPIFITGVRYTSAAPNVTEEKVIKVRQLIREGVPVRSIARRLGLSRSQVYHIRSRRSYNWVKEPKNETMHNGKNR